MLNTLFEVSCRLPYSYNSTYEDALSVYAGKIGFPFLRDRFGYLNKYSPYNIYSHNTKFPKSNNTTEFSELMDKRAIDIISIAKKNDLPLYVFYSGGVDSTAMLVALMKVCESYENIQVIHTCYAYEENPEFTKLLQSFGISMRMVSPGLELEQAQTECLKNGFVLTGWCADQLFGSIIHKDYQYLFYDDWKKWLNEKRYDTAIQQLEESFSFYGLPIKTFGEFAWFMNFLVSMIL